MSGADRSLHRRTQGGSLVARVVVAFMRRIESPNTNTDSAATRLKNLGGSPNRAVTRAMLIDASSAAHTVTGLARDAGASSSRATTRATAPTRSSAAGSVAHPERSSRQPYWMDATRRPATTARSQGDMGGKLAGATA